MNMTPIKKQAGQSVEEMATQLAEVKNNKRKNTYPEISADMKSETLSTAIDQQLEFLAQIKERGKVNLHNLPEVELTAVNYLNSCKIAGVLPDMLGFACACGCSRKWIYEFIRLHPEEETAVYLDGLRSAFAAVTLQMGATRQYSEPVTIFMLKNSGQGLADRAEIDITAKANNPLGEEQDTEILKQKYLEDTYGTNEP